MPSAALPSYLRILLSVRLDVMNGAAASMKEIYFFAYGAIVDVLPRTRTISSRYIKPNTAIQMPQINDAANPSDAWQDALFTSFCASLREIMLPEPCPNINPKACMTAMNPNTTPTAPLALVPSRPTKAVSARLYIFVTSIDIIVGTESVSISFCTGVPVIFSYCVIFPFL